LTGVQAGATVTEQLTVEVWVSVPPAESVTVTENGKAPADGGVPVRAPVVGFKDNHEGNEVLLKE
jgi:hypothetical protein